MAVLFLFLLLLPALIFFPRQADCRSQQPERQAQAQANVRVGPTLSELFLAAPAPEASEAAARPADPDLAPYAAVAWGAKTLRLSFRLQRALDAVGKAAFRFDPVFAGALDPAWNALIGRLEKDGFERRTTQRIFAYLGPKSYTPAYMGMKITELYGVFGIGVRRDGPTTPEVPSQYQQPVPDATIGSCLAFMHDYADVLADIEAKHGVSADVILSILLIETGFGLNLGNDVALRALASMASTTTVERLASGGNGAQAQRVSAAALSGTLREKSNWAYNEVKALLRQAEAMKLDAWKIPGSFYGAIGICQFMPSNIEPYGVDGDQDGVVNLFSVVDAMYSVARYLEANGWRSAKAEGQRHAVVMTYNKDALYASAVLATSKRLGQALKGKISPKTYALVGGYGSVPSARLDPSLRRLRPVPPRAKIQSLGSYGTLLQ